MAERLAKRMGIGPFELRFACFPLDLDAVRAKESVEEAVQRATWQVMLVGVKSPRFIRKDGSAARNLCSSCFIYVRLCSLRIQRVSMIFHDFPSSMEHNELFVL